MGMAHFWERQIRPKTLEKPKFYGHKSRSRSQKTFPGKKAWKDAENKVLSGFQFSICNIHIGMEMEIPYQYIL
jgi:hypothetical protein